MPSEFKSNSTSDCHAKCGTGYRTVTTTNCEFDKSKGMLCNIVQKTENCTVEKSCPADYEYGEWSQWSDCETICRRGIEDKRYQNRTRKCMERSCNNDGKKIIYSNLYVRNCELVQRLYTY